MKQNRTNQSGMRFVREMALTVGAVSGAVFVIAALSALIFGIKPLVFQSGSMSPSIDTGALAFARTVPASDIHVGDVISVNDAQGNRITHRVVGVDTVSGDIAEVRLQGDANEQADIEPYAITAAERVFFHANGFGYVASWLTSPVAKTVGLLSVGLMLTTVIWSNGRRRDDNPIQAMSRIRPRKPLILAVVLLTTIGTIDISGTSAALTVSASAKSGAFGTKAAFVPRINTPLSGGRLVDCEEPGFYDIRVSWKHIGAPYTYKIALRTMNNQIYTTFNVTPPAGAAAGATVTAGYGPFPNTNGLAFDFNLEVHTALPSSGAVSSAWAGTVIHRPASGTRARCGRASSTGVVRDASGDDPVPANSPAMAGAQRRSLDPESTSEVAPTTPPDAASTTAQPTTAQPTTVQSTTTAPSATAAPGETSTTSPDPTAPTVPPVAPAPTDKPLTSPVGSSSGKYTAQVVQSETGPSAVIRNGENEVYRTAVSVEDVVGWVPGTDVLQIVTESGAWTVSNSSGTWVKATVVPPPAAPPVPAPGQTPTVEQVPEEPTPSTDSGPA
ncbi:signal peptidase I [Rhodococcus sp. H36-A4]|uniref:signal peptidase I n=1 Tax=Rhodococcus sp. H36-A4 TaxID=3004353 RepID=UPI0022AED3FF|nr:signal peptidase I [Rhodococcus sp. H36-A4]MCZ4080478.1 signal peptidase I [Rhodococcus sp. H36-A4]